MMAVVGCGGVFWDKGRPLHCREFPALLLPTVFGSISHLCGRVVVSSVSTDFEMYAYWNEDWTAGAFTLPPTMPRGWHEFLPRNQSLCCKNVVSVRSVANVPFWLDYAKLQIRYPMWKEMIDCETPSAAVVDDRHHRFVERHGYLFSTSTPSCCNKVINWIILFTTTCWMNQALS